MDIESIFKNLNKKKIEEEYAYNKEEDLNLDFKLADGNFTAHDDKKNFAKALSAFANSDGGLIIWGIDSRQNNGIDCSNGVKHIKSLKKGITRLNTLTGELVSPLVEGIRHKAIKLNEEGGVIVTLIPASDSGPHMAKGTENRYYKRSGDSFYCMEHFDIEDMFGRRKKPVLDIYIYLETGSSMVSGYEESRECKIIIGLINSGRGIARYPYISLKINSSYKMSEFGLDGNRNVGLPRLVTGIKNGITKYGGNGNIIIHPNTILEVSSISYNAIKGNNKFSDLIIEYELCAEGCKIVKGVKIVPSSEIYNRVYMPSEA